MRYTLNTKIESVQDDYEPKAGERIIEVLTEEEYAKMAIVDDSHLALAGNIAQVHCCKADNLKNAVVGTFLIPDKNNLLEKEDDFSFRMDKDKILFIDDGNTVKDILRHLSEIEISVSNNFAHFMFEFMGSLIRDDVLFLQGYEDELIELEEKLLEGDVPDFHKHMLKRRRELLKLTAYYHQLTHLSDEFEENANNIFEVEDERLFDMYATRLDRLLDNVKLLREYTLQMRELYQSQIDIRQNKVIQFLTVVTTVFMPLTLIVGWYGMNFKIMPELSFRFGYLIIILISITITILEVLYFKKKKWL